MNLTNIASVFIGAGVGGALRYVLGELATSRWSTAFPWHTIAINVGGSFFLGLITAIGLQREAMTPELRLFLGVGILGGFTTFSTLSYETVALFQQGLILQAVANMFGSVVLGVVAASLGVLVGRAL